ncbi:MAG: thioredoxin-disulfide reductase [Candidatus Micrarchaeaceae archaeon]|nr:thioredoxin-disulfide reductase [Candidatus Parvarchaeota archaeon]
MVEKVIIMGSGPAGYAAAIYAARNDLDPLLIRGSQAGGQLMLTSFVENYPGFDSILGPDLMEKMNQHSRKFIPPSKIIDDDVVSVDLNGYPYKINTGDKAYETYSLIIASGASAKWLGLENERRLIGKGVSGCAVCDAFFFKDKSVVVIGGGDSAMEDAGYLSKFAKDVTIIHRRDKFRASSIMQDRVFSNPKIKVIWNTVVEDILGKDHVEGVKLKNVNDGTETSMPTQGVFIAIGHSPNTDIFKGQLDLDSLGYIVTHDNVKTSKEGVFAAGDVQDRKYKQAVIAAGWGAMAAIDATKFLEEKGIVK